MKITSPIQSLLLILLLSCSMTLIAESPVLYPDEELSDVTQRDYWLPQEVNLPGTAEKFQKGINAMAIPGKNLGPISIALIYPSADVSDFWRRSYIAMTQRLEELNIKFETLEFESQQIQHSLQTQFTNEVISQKDKFDFVVFGPSELSLQAHNIDKLASQHAFETFIWAFHTPLKKFKQQPRMWFDFSSSVGALTLCQHMIKRLGSNRIIGMNRGIPGVTDDQRSGEFKSCTEREGDWEVAYEHFGQYRQAGGKDGANLMQQYYPDISYIHNANTAMTLGAIEAVATVDKLQRPLLSGWGGTALEVEAVRNGDLNATPMRMNDDLGVATAEAIKYILDNREHELPLIYLGRIEILDDSMTSKEITSKETQAFRYSGVASVN